METIIQIAPPSRDEYPEWFAGEIEQAKYEDLLYGLEDSFHKTITFLHHIREDKLLFPYAPGKWTIKELWQHVIDVERVLSYRALRYARHDTTVLPGFDEKSYAEYSNGNHRNWDDLLEEYTVVRQSTIWLFRSFTPATIMLKGTSGHSQLTVRAVGFLILGHEIHHVRIIKERYLT